MTHIAAHAASDTTGITKPAALIDACAQQALSGNGIFADQALALSELPAAFTMDILAAARRVTTAFKTEDTFTCGIVNGKSGRCSENCAFCAQSRHHDTGVAVYPLLETDTLLDRALELAEAGADRYGIVTSGNTVNGQELDRLCEAALQITARTSLKLCASLGQLTPERALQLRQAGFSSYHHNLETAESFFPHICTTHPYADDIATVRHALAAGFRVCSGGILGLGESPAQRVELAMTLRELDVHSVPVNFLNPIAGTRLADRAPLHPMAALRSLALFRLIMPRKDILVAGGREHTLGQYQSWIFMAGANGMMIGNYLTTSGRNMTDDMTMLRDLGLAPSSSQEEAQ
ncbi:biotin synthase BioB [Desulfovibrio mangrovi]|uniref:biotin synthase BioB n=1 Tax=Desulfovibrio mangrovi TaxID=2976983 RepID=UPI0022474E35|nr:biotin synthase BioB [Desulfovibrio mangrovi]UZP66735.1 biotin synthase BioB [Desulfovibrio mangrovi]